MINLSTPAQLARKFLHDAGLENGTENLPYESLERKLAAEIKAAQVQVLDAVEEAMRNKNQVPWALFTDIDALRADLNL